MAGEPISDPDLQIASIVLEHDAALVTHNQRHFSRLTNLAGLAFEDWLVQGNESVETPRRGVSTTASG